MNILLVIFGLMICFTVSANELTLNFYRSPHLTWESPRKLAQSASHGFFQRNINALGHVTVGLKCSGKSIITGMYPKKLSSLSSYVLKGYGLGVLFKSVPGKLESHEDIQKYHDRFAQKGDMSFITFKVSASTCERMMDYIDEYRRNAHYDNYGLTNRPLYGEGGGCSAFGVSLLQVGGLLETEFIRQWGNFIRVPRNLVGGPETGNRVFFINKKKWSSPEEDYLPLFFWDPDRMYHYVAKKYDDFSGHMESKMLKTKYLNAKGIIFDFVYKKTPDGPLFLSESIGSPKHDLNKEVYYQLWPQDWMML